jgi:outer membrane immunogenic protein
MTMKTTTYLLSAFAGGLLTALAAAQPSMAADVAAPVYKAAAVAAAYDWTGFYVGGNLGYGSGKNTDPNLTLVDPGPNGALTHFLTTGLLGFTSGNLFPNLNPSGVFGGMEIGYDRQFGTWVLGAVADIQASDFRASGLIATPFATTGANFDESLSAKIDWFGTVRGKAGFAANDWLLYGTGGLAYGETKSTIGFACTPGGAGCSELTFAGSVSETKLGWSAGAGVSKALGNWNVGLEYLHVDLGHSSVTAFSTNGTLATTHIIESQRFVEDTVRLTVNYKWGGQVVAKY